MNDTHIAKTLRLLVITLATITATATASASEPDDNALSQEFTKDHPLIYEDVWDLWPYSFLNEKGEPDGFNIDLMKIMMKELNVHYVVKMRPRADVLRDLKEGRSDLTMGLAAGFNDEYGLYSRNAITLFTQSVATPKSKNTDIRTFRDLSKHKITVYYGSLAHHLMEDYGWGDSIDVSRDMGESIQRISASQSGSLVWNTLSLKWLLHKYQIEDVELSPIDMPHGQYKFMSQNPQLLNILDSLYTNLNASDQLTTIQNKWFYPERNESKVHPWVWYTTGGVAVVALLFVFYLINYRIQGRQNTEAIQRKNKRLALILETSQVRMWTYDTTTHLYTWYNENGQPAYNYTSAEFAHRYKPEDYDKLKNAIWQIASQDKEEVTLDIQAQDEEDGDAQLKDFNIALSVLRKDSEGRPTVILGTKRDITEQRKQQQLTQEQTLRYWSIFNTSMINVIFYNQDGILTNINESACKTFQCNKEEILAEKVQFRDMTAFGDIDFNNADGIYATEIIDLDETIGKAAACKRKGRVYFETLLIAVRDENQKQTGLFAIGRDITAEVEGRDRMQEHIDKTKSTTADLQTFINNINYILSVGGVRIVTYSPDNHMLTIHRGVKEVQQSLTQARCMTLIDDRWKRRAMRMLSSMDNRHNVNIDTDIRTVIRERGGCTMHLEFHFVPTFDARGTLTEYFGICRDISEQKATEKQLERETTKAQEIENTKNAFLKNMSYEIRTPLNAVVGFAELFEADHASDDEAVFVNEILSNSDHLLHLINGILFLSRLDANMIEINKKPTDFATLFDNYCNNAWDRYKKEGVKYAIENPYESLVIDIDAANLGRVIEQVVTNAAQHTHNGTVRVRYDYIGRRLMISVEDTGDGINPELQKRIFERFVTGGQTTSGLGLPISQELVKQMGGNLEINSEMGMGTTVWITLPCQAHTTKRKKFI